MKYSNILNLSYMGLQIMRSYDHTYFICLLYSDDKSNKYFHSYVPYSLESGYSETS